MVRPFPLQIPEEPFDPERLMDNVHIQSGTVTVRMAFYKVGALQFISHLDLQRSMKRAFLRSGLPIWFSEGFNPHPKMIFSTPLSIGVESVCEFTDVKMTRVITPREIMERLNPCMPETLQVYYVAPPVHKMTDIGWSSYDYVIEHPMASPETAQALNALYKGPLTVTKRTKSGDRETDIAPYIKSAQAVYEEGVIRLSATLCADNQNFLNPEYLIRGAEQALSLSFADPVSSRYTICRKGIFLADGVTPFF